MDIAVGCSTGAGRRYENLRALRWNGTGTALLLDHGTLNRAQETQPLRRARLPG